MTGFLRAWFAFLLLLPLSQAADARTLGDANMPSVLEPLRPEVQRAIEISDLLSLRDVVALSVSPGGQRYAIILRQADADANRYNEALFVGELASRRLRRVSDVGEAALQIGPTGTRSGELESSRVGWSPDGRKIAYLQRFGLAKKLTIVDVKANTNSTISFDKAEVVDFRWLSGSKIWFAKAQSPSAQKARQPNAEGTNIDQIDFLTEFINWQSPSDLSQLSWWVLNTDTGQMRARPDNLSSHSPSPSSDNPLRAIGPQYREAWIEVVDPSTQSAVMPIMGLKARLPDGKTLSCELAPCRGQAFQRLWTYKDEVIFWRKEGEAITNRDALYIWRPRDGRLRKLYGSKNDSLLTMCSVGSYELVCVRELRDRPNYLISISMESGSIRELADPNPEFGRVRLGRVEPISWKLPPEAVERGYPSHAHGSILYPPNYDPSKRYPVFIAPYTASGFARGDYGDEHPLWVYAEKGMIVLNTAFPQPFALWARETQASVLAKDFDADSDYPHLRILADSTLQALAELSHRTRIETSRVGIGGVSHGSYIPMFILQRYDRLAAVSVGGPGWSQDEYYFSTQAGREGAAKVGLATEWPEDREFWSGIDLSDHVNAIEAPILFNMAEQEIFGGFHRLQRRMSDAGKPYDAYLYKDEFHSKVWPAHRLSIYGRNLRWFKFWLLDVEDSDPRYASEYGKWRRLRLMRK